MYLFMVSLNVLTNVLYLPKDVSELFVRLFVSSCCGKLTIRSLRGKICCIWGFTLRSFKCTFGSTRHPIFYQFSFFLDILLVIVVGGIAVTCKQGKRASALVKLYSERLFRTDCNMKFGGKLQGSGKYVFIMKVGVLM